MKIRVLCSALAALSFALLPGAQAQQPAKLPTIGWLSPVSLASDAQRELLGRELHVLGYVEGKNIAKVYRHADDRLDRLPELAKELVGLKVDVLVVYSTSAAVALKKATTTIPIIFFNVSDPIAVGLIDSLARPGGNITGITNIVGVLSGKRLELLKETVPKVSRVAVLWNPQDPASAQQWEESRPVARALGLQLHSMAVSSTDKYAEAFKEAIKAGSGALAVTGHAMALANQKQITDLATKNRLSAVYHRDTFVASGGLMSYGDDQTELYRRVAIFVDKILKGTKPYDIPVEQPTKFEFVVNLKAAKQIGLTIPPNVLVRAQRVIR